MQPEWLGEWERQWDDLALEREWDELTMERVWGLDDELPMEWEVIGDCAVWCANGQGTAWTLGVVVEQDDRLIVLLCILM